MTGFQNNRPKPTYFSKLPPTQEVKEERLQDLLSLIERSLHVFPTHLYALEGYSENKTTITEHLYNLEFSDCFQEIIIEEGFAGYFKFHDEGANSKKLVSNKKKGIPKRVDISIRLSGSREQFLVIEGKRLHDKYDKQYVSGGTGGISRFKREEHGEDEGMNLACIVGYVQKETFAFWHQKINLWLNELSQKDNQMKWHQKEELSKLETNDIIAQCASNHCRVTLPSIEIRHFWVDVS